MDRHQPDAVTRAAPVFDNRTHRAYAFRRTGRGKNATGRLRWSGLGYIGSARAPEDIAAMLGVEVDVVRQSSIFSALRPAYGHFSQ